MTITQITTQMPQITPCLWFDDNLDEVIAFYTSVFPDAKVGNASRSGGNATVATFELEGQKFMAINGGPLYQFTEAVSFFVGCKSQAEIDEYWTKLSAGGEEGRCGWLKDRFGLSWQVIPDVLGQLLARISHQISPMCEK